MAAFVMAPLAKAAMAALAFVLFKPRTSDGERPAQLDTSALDELASSPASSASSTATTSSASVPVGASSASSAPLSASEVQAVLGSRAAELDARAARELATSNEPASSASSIATTSSASVPLDDGARLEVQNTTPIDDESARSAARALHAYVMRTPSSRRDRVYVRAMQAAMGGIAVDGLIGRATAARIKALTGLRIPGLS